MIPPLYIHIVHFHYFVHDYVGSGTSVIYITDYMQLVNSKGLYQLAQGLYKAVCYAGVKYRGDYLVVVVFLYHVVGYVQQLVKDIHHILWYALANP